MKELDQHTKNMIVKLDGWSNVLTGLGRQGKDKRTGMSADWQRMDWDQVEHIYACDDTAEKIVDVPVDEAFRKQPIFKKKDMDAEFNKDLWDYLNEINFLETFKQSAKWGRMYGGGFLMFGIADGNDPDTEVDFERIHSVEWFNKLHRWDMNSADIIHDVSNKFFREPERYVFTRGALSESELAGPMVHRSRVVRLEGARLPERLYRANNYFNDSVLNRVQNAIENFNSSHDSLAVLLQDFSGGVFKMKNLAQLIGAGQDDAVLKRMQLIDLKRSMVKSIVIDADEDFERKATPLSGIKDAIQKIDDRLVAASKMPHNILLGDTTGGGLNSGEGGSEQEQWDDYIRNLQQTEYKPAFMESMRILLSAKDNPVTKGIIPEGFDMTFPPLQEPSPKEKAEVYKMTADGDAIYINAQVLDPNEVAISRFSDDEFNQDTQIDVDIREEKLEEGPETDILEGIGGVDGGAENAIPKLSLNGAQVRSMIDTTVQFKSGVLDKESALTILTTAFPIDEKTASKILGDLGEIPDNVVEETTRNIKRKRDNGFVQDHYHDFGAGVMTSGLKMKDDGTHTHTYWVSGVKYETNTSPTGEVHTHELMHREGMTGGAVHFENEIRIDAIEKVGSQYVLTTMDGKHVLGKFKSKKKAEDAKQEMVDEFESKAGKKGPELLPKDD